MSLKSFRDARSAFARNLNNILAKLNYTPASLSMKLNNAAIQGGSAKSVISASEVQDWTSGKKVPSLYAFFKLCDYLRVNMDEFLDPNFQLATAIGRSFANQTAAAPKIASILDTGTINMFKEMKKNNNPFVEEVDLLTPYVEKVEITIAPAPHKAKPVKVPTTGKVLSQDTLRKTLVNKHTTSTNSNYKLAYAVLTSGKSTAEVAKAVDISTRSLRDYMYYGVTVPEKVAYKLLRTLKTCNYATLGLKYDVLKERYTHV